MQKKYQKTIKVIIFEQNWYLLPKTIIYIKNIHLIQIVVSLEEITSQKNVKEQKTKDKKNSPEESFDLEEAIKSLSYLG